MDVARVSSKGQVVIPSGVRARHQIAAGTLLGFYEMDDIIVMKPMDTEQIRKDLEEFRKLRARTRKLSPAAIDRAIHEYRKGRA